MSIQDVEESLDIVDLDAGPPVHIGRDHTEWLVTDGPGKAAADGGIHDLAVRAPRSMAFPGEGVSDVIVQREGGSV